MSSIALQLSRLRWTAMKHSPLHFLKLFSRTGNSNRHLTLVQNSNQNSNNHSHEPWFSKLCDDLRLAVGRRTFLKNNLFENHRFKKTLHSRIILIQTYIQQSCVSQTKFLLVPISANHSNVLIQIFRKNFS